MKNAFETFLDSCDTQDWSHALAVLSGEIHEVDRTATRIWFAFFPLNLHQALQRTDNPEQLAKRLLLQGKYELKDQIDSSHHFLYGHRFWPEAKRAVIEHADSFTDTEDKTDNGATLARHIRKVAEQAAAQIKQDVSLTLGITAIAFMTVAQVGLKDFKASAGAITKTNKTPEQILRERARDDSQGLFGFLKSVDKEWTVVYDETDKTARFKTIHGEEIASGAARDRSRDWRAVDPRRIEGPIPVECRSASCGTCWIGVIGGAEKLSPVSAREGRMMKEFGYIDTNEDRPMIRLACMAQAEGAVSIVIPPWNGVFGKFLRQQKDASGDSRAESDLASQTD
jgi:ferredoxin